MLLYHQGRTKASALVATHLGADIEGRPWRAVSDDAAMGRMGALQ